METAVDFRVVAGSTLPLAKLLARPREPRRNRPLREAKDTGDIARRHLVRGQVDDGALVGREIRETRSRNSVERNGSCFAPPRPAP